MGDTAERRLGRRAPEDDVRRSLLGGDVPDDPDEFAPRADQQPAPQRRHEPFQRGRLGARAAVAVGADPEDVERGVESRASR